MNTNPNDSQYVNPNDIRAAAGPAPTRAEIERAKAYGVRLTSQHWPLADEHFAAQKQQRDSQGAA